MNSKERVRTALKITKPAKNWKPGWIEREIGLFPYGISLNHWDRPDWVQTNPEFEGLKWKKIPHEEIDEWGKIWKYLY